MEPEARDAMMLWLGPPSNPSSIHRAGQKAAAVLEQAREDVAALVGGNPAGVVFTSGATEANHLAMTGLYRISGRRSWLIGALEHPCVFGAGALLGELGAKVEVAPAEPGGVYGAGAWALLNETVAGLSCMAVNHEIGTVQDVGAALAACRRVGARLHVDAAQAVARISLQLGEVDAVTVSAHKIGGPVGIGALILRDGEPFPPLLRGGSQERGRRAGTPAVAAAAGFAAAARATLARRRASDDRQTRQTADLLAVLRRAGARILAEESPRVPGVVSVVFAGLRGEQVVQALDLRGFAVSSGAACASGSIRPSPVLVAIGDPEPAGIVRFSLGPTTTDAEITALDAVLGSVLQTVRDGLAWSEE
jgi:cysteine desulfurase